MELRPLPLIFVSVALAAAAGAVAGSLMSPAASPGANAAESSNSAELRELVARVDARQGEIEKTLDELQSAISAAGNARAEVVDVDAAIERWMKEHAGAALESAPSTAAAPAKSRQQRVAEAFEALADENLSDVERQRLWREFAKEGLTDDLLAEFERRCEFDPTNPDLKVELANAYFMKIAEVGNTSEAGVWGEKADKLLDAALENDPNHWEARFTKAVALSFWPAFLGKQKEAASHLEILVAQQSGQPKQDKFAQTHLILGNMYQQLGQADKAVAAWQAGYALFPTDAELKKQLELYGK